MNTVPKKHHEAHIWGDGVNFALIFSFLKKKYLFIVGCVAWLQHMGILLPPVGVRNAALRHVKS